MFFCPIAILGLAALPSLVSSQLASGYTVGPLTTSSAKFAKKVCDVTSYGGVADGKTDVGPAILAAFNACINGGVVNIPLGIFAMATWVTLTGGTAWAINLEGIIERTGTGDPGGTMISIIDATDFEIYSTRSAGAIQGFGYQFHEQGLYGPRLLRLTTVNNFAIHDIALVDAGAFHLVLSGCQNGEVYNTIIRGGNEGGLDGIDVSGFNIWIHDVEVTNKDECVTVKSPANNMLIENIYCNWSGGSAIGSLGVDTAITEITYNNIYSVNCNQMFMIKSNGGSGTVSNSVFSNFIGHGNAYSLDINGYWTEETLAAGAGVTFTDLTFSNWKGTCSAGATRGPINIICPDGAPCNGITLTNFAIWTDTGTTEWYKCESAWGTGGCLKSGTTYASYAVTTSTISAAPSGYSAPTMPSDLQAGLGITVSIAIPTIPTTFFPGATPATKRAYP